MQVDGNLSTNCEESGALFTALCLTGTAWPTSESSCSAMKASVRLCSKSGRQRAAGERALGTTKVRTGVLWRLKLVTNPLKHFQSGLKSTLIFNWAWKRAIFSKREDQRSTVTSNNCAYSKVCRCPVAAGRMTNAPSRTGTGRFSLHFFTFKFRAMATTMTYAHVNTRLPEAR